MFEKASRMKLRFDTPQGYISVEDLWDIPLTSKTGKANLDAIALALHHEVKDSSDIHSFVDDAAVPKDTLPKLRFDTVIHVINVRKAENEKVAKAKLNKEKKQFLLQVIAQKETEAVLDKSKDEIQDMINSL